MSTHERNRTEHRRKPEWLRVPVRSGGNLRAVRELLRNQHLHTVCEEAGCPNRMECFSSRTATFMILGDICTRDCRFCGVHSGSPAPPDPGEPRRLAEAVRELGLKHVVVTSVTRDDLPDGGAGHFAAVVRQVRALCGPGGSPGEDAVPEANGSPGDDAAPGQGVTIELLVPDFLGTEEALETVVETAPEIINHNLETVPRLYPAVRAQAEYGRSLQLLARVKRINPAVYTKSGIMVGLGETAAEVEAVMDDLRGVGCDFLTIGQYLPPSNDHYPLSEYVHPDTFRDYRRIAYEKGFSFVAADPLVRSSYRAAEVFSDRE
jgi:lipoic acid synthetase